MGGRDFNARRAEKGFFGKTFWRKGTNVATRGRVVGAFCSPLGAVILLGPLRGAFPFISYSLQQLPSCPVHRGSEMHSKVVVTRLHRKMRVAARASVFTHRGAPPGGDPPPNCHLQMGGLMEP
jgi:hypothetical protein